MATMKAIEFVNSAPAAWLWLPGMNAMPRTDVLRRLSPR
jgi:hypothetical protein